MLSLLAALLILHGGVWRSVPGGSWAPDQTTMSAVRKNIEPFVHKQANPYGRLPAWESYSFEYQGQVKDGRRFIFISGVCHEDDPPPTDAETPHAGPLTPADEYFLRQFHAPLDGGPCVFRVSYDPKRHKFFDFSYNGVG
jgi:hypothetical protein